MRCSRLAIGHDARNHRIASLDDCAEKSPSRYPSPREQRRRAAFSASTRTRVFRTRAGRPSERFDPTAILCLLPVPRLLPPPLPRDSFVYLRLQRNSPRKLDPGKFRGRARLDAIDIAEIGGQDVDGETRRDAERIPRNRAKRSPRPRDIFLITLLIPRRQ